MDTIVHPRLGPVVLSALLTLVVCRPARGNGAFPAVSQLVADPSDSKHLVLRSTFGLLTTRDQGTNWDLICEAGIGYENILPPIAVLGSGVTVAALLDGIAYGSQNECAFEHSPGLTGYFADVSRVPGSAHEAVAVSVDLNRAESQVWRTLDDGKTWSTWGTPLPDMNAATLDVAGDASNVYVSGVALKTNLTGSLAHSTDGGKTWVSHLIPIPSKLNGPFIAAVAPNDESTLYVRLAGTPGHLLVTHDAGQTIEPVLDFQGAVEGFALSPDGKLALASGGVDGVWRARTTDLSFARISCAKLRCLSWTASGLFACADEFEAGFLVGESQDDGASFEARLHLSCVRGPLDCARTSSVASVCPAAWPAISEQLGTDCDSAGSFTPSTSCSDNAAGDGGAPASDAGAEIAGASSANLKPHGGCAFAPDQSAPLAPAMGGWAFFVLIRRRKRRVENAVGRC